MQEANVGAEAGKKGVIERCPPRFRAWLQMNLIWTGVVTEATEIQMHVLV